MIEYDKPMDIERRSFEIITQLLGEQVIPAENELVVKRVIHTTADFDYAENLAFSDHAVAQGIAALRAGCDIVTDTQMARSGINKRVLEGLGGQVHCFMSEAEVASSRSWTPARPISWPGAGRAAAMWPPPSAMPCSIRSPAEPWRSISSGRGSACGWGIPPGPARRRRPRRRPGCC